MKTIPGYILDQFPNYIMLIYLMVEKGRPFVTHSDTYKKDVN